jgi:ELWxxDGT repeat protein
MVVDLNPGSGNAGPDWMTDIGGVLVFTAADDGVNGQELWASDGTAAGTVLLRDINPGPAGASITGLTVVTNMFGPRVFFVATDPTHGRELWVTDGTPAGTQLVTDIRPGTTGANPASLREFRSRLFFQANDGVAGAELWESDGTAAGTRLVADINLGSSGASPANLVEVNRTLYFAASDGTTGTGRGTELWATDGTTAGTYRVADINPGTASSSPALLTSYNEQLYFTAIDGVTGRELWTSDGTAAGTTIVLDVNAGSGSAVPNLLGIANGRLFFAATAPAFGTELWSTDGTAAGTQLVKDIAPGADNGALLGFAALDGFAVFAANDGVTGLEPWRTDGTAAGTVQIKDIMPGTLGSVSSRGFMIALQGADRALFAASDGVHGVELWRTDGTAAGTVMHQDIAPGARNSNPGWPVQIGCLTMFSANDGTNGDELWAMTGTASARNYGLSCVGTGGAYPHIAGTGGAPRLGNSAFGLKVHNALPAAPCLKLLFLGRLSFPLGAGCFLHGDPSLMIGSLSSSTGPTGVSISSLPVPNDPALACAQLFVQGVVLDPNGAYLGLAPTEGLIVLINQN